MGWQKTPSKEQNEKLAACTRAQRTQKILLRGQILKGMHSSRDDGLTSYSTAL